jgi:membrane protease YdiL (CAAX protease family)
VIAILLQAVGTVFLNIIYARSVVALGGPGAAGEPHHRRPGHVRRALPHRRAAAQHVAAHGENRVSRFILAWSGVGEELYFRGYVQGVLRRHHSAR